MKAEIKEMPAYTVAYVRKVGPYNQTASTAFAELSQWAGPAGHLGKGELLGLYWDNPEVTAPEKCRMDACVSVPEGTVANGRVDIQTIAGGPYGICRFQINSEGFQQAWEEAFAWLVENGYACAEQPCYELYHNNAADHPEGKWIVDICIPLAGD